MDIPAGCPAPAGLRARLKGDHALRKHAKRLYDCVPKPLFGMSALWPMPRFFFHVRDRDQLTEGPEGIDFPDLEAAQADARIAVRNVLAEQLASDSTISNQQLEICDEAGQLLATVPFRDAIEPL